MTEHAAGVLVPDTARPCTVLFLCTGNSHRSIIAEAILNRAGAGRFHAFSAGSRPAGQVDPATLALLRRLGHPIAGLRSKSWDAFARADAPPLDIVVTVCDSAAGEVCPIWPGAPVATHWGVPDPAHAAGPTARRRALVATYRTFARRLDAFLRLPFAELDWLSLKRRLDEIGRLLPGPRSARA